MALDVFFSRDIERVLVSLASAGAGRGPEYHKALADVGLAFGVVSPVSTSKTGGPVLVDVSHVHQVGQVDQRPADILAARCARQGVGDDTNAEQG